MYHVCTRGSLAGPWPPPNPPPPRPPTPPPPLRLDEAQTLAPTSRLFYIVAPVVVGMLACWYGVCLLLLRHRRRGVQEDFIRGEELTKAAVDPEEAPSELASDLAAFTRERQELRDTTRWLVQLDLGDDELEMSIPKRSIKDAKALRRAIADACLASAGSQQTPRKWRQGPGRAIGMQIQYLDNEDEFRTLTSSTAFRDIKQSLRLHVMPT